MTSSSRYAEAAPRLSALAAGLAVLALALLFIYQTEQARVLQRQQFAAAIAGEHGHAIEQQFHAAISATYALAAFLRHNQGDLAQFEAIAGEILAYHRGIIKNLQLAPRGVVSRIHPLAGQEKAIGHDLFKDPKRRDEALLAVKRKSLTLAGPFDLVQGGRGVIARLPVFLPEGGGERFWGFVTALIDSDALLRASQLAKLDTQGYFYLLSRPAADAPQSVASNLAGRDVELLKVGVDLPGVRWELGIAPRSGWLGGWALAGEIGVALLLALLAGKLAAALAQRVALQAALADINANLEARVAEEVAHNREKELLLIRQSRYAVMGEMIGNIAHQWRQPLNTLDLLLANIQDDYDYGELDGVKLREYANTGHKITANMSRTIDDFRDFFRPNKEKRHFPLREAVEQTLDILSASLKAHSITVELDIPDGLEAWGHPNEFGQVLVNLVNNARDAIDARHPHGGGRIAIAARRSGEWLEVTLRDNGGGIAGDVLDKVFDPYFTTKAKGTGIGLYMSRMIATDSLGGSLDVANRDDGAEFILRVPTGDPAAPPETPRPFWLSGHLRAPLGLARK